MENTIVEKDNITIIRLDGEIDVTMAPRLKKLFQETIESGKNRILVDLEKVEFIDSSGLGILVVAFKLAKAKKGALVFANPGAQVLKTIQLTRLDKHFEIFDSIDKAMMSLQ